MARYVVRINRLPPALIIFLLIFLPDFAARGEEAYNLGEIVVTANRIPTAFAQISRCVSIIDSRDIEDAPVHSLPELLGYVTSIDARRRGVEGVQADISIRGSTFEQALILVDGMKVNDPQTGHHNMDIPLVLADIERIEILHGGGSALYGPNALSGVINIITKKPQERKGTASFLIGENSLTAGSLSFAFPCRAPRHSLSLSKRESGGYQYNTAFNCSTVSYRTAIETVFAALDFSLGYTDKEFGANSFYSNLYPHQWEVTETTLMSLKARAGSTGGIIFAPKLYWRRHRDKFILNRTNPNSFSNRHTTDIYGGEIDLHIPFDWGKLALGGELGEEKIDSTNLGNRARTRGAFFAEFQPKTGEKFFLTVGMREDYYEDWSWEGSPGIGLGYKINPALKLRTAFGRSFRVPTYTELYYDSPANKGNADLRTEQARSYEIGLDGVRKGISWGATLFRREGKNLIDWVRETGSDPWEAANISKMDTDGLEVLVKIKPRVFDQQCPFSLISFGYTYLDSDREESSLQSKYVMDYLRHQAFFGLNHFLPFRIRQTWKLKFNDRVSGGSYFLVDTRLSRKLKKKDTEIFVAGTNLFDKSYEEIGGVTMPGKWISAGVTAEF